MSAPMSRKRYGSPAGVAIDDREIRSDRLAGIEGDRQREEQAARRRARARVRTAGNTLVDQALERLRRRRAAARARGRGFRRRGICALSWPTRSRKAAARSRPVAVASISLNRIRQAVVKSAARRSDMTPLNRRRFLQAAAGGVGTLAAGDGSVVRRAGSAPPPRPRSSWSAPARSAGGPRSTSGKWGTPSR